MDRALVDTNVIIDFLTNRKPWSENSAKIFEYSKRGNLEIYVSFQSIGDIYYVIRKLSSRTQALNSVKRLAPLIRIISPKKEVLEKALLSNFTDFEDALQNYSAIQEGLEKIITRNPKDYTRSEILIFTPKEYLSSMKD